MSRASRLLQSLYEAEGNKTYHIEDAFIDEKGNFKYGDSKTLNPDTLKLFTDKEQPSTRGGIEAYKNMTYNFVVMNTMLENSHSFRVVDKNQKQDFFTLKEKTGNEDCFVLRLEKTDDQQRYWIPYKSEDKQIKRLRNNKTWETVEDNNVPKGLKDYFQRNTDSTGKFKMGSDRGSYESEINELLKFTNERVDQSERDMVLGNKQNTKKNECLKRILEDENNQDISNSSPIEDTSTTPNGQQKADKQNKNNAKQNLYPTYLTKEILLFRIQKAGWVISKVIKNYPALIVTKDRQRQYVLVNENPDSEKYSSEKEEQAKPKWEIGSVSSNSTGSDYQFYDRKLQTLVTADKDLKRQHKKMTDIIRNTNFKSDLYKPLGNLANTLGQGIGSAIGSSLLGPLGAHLGKAASTWAMDKLATVDVKGAVANQANKVIEKTKKFLPK